MIETRRRGRYVDKTCRACATKAIRGFKCCVEGLYLKVMNHGGTGEVAHFGGEEVKIVHVRY